MLMDSGSREWQLLSWLFLSNRSILAVPCPHTARDLLGEAQPALFGTAWAGLQTTDLIPLNLFSHLKSRPLTCQRL